MAARVELATRMLESPLFRRLTTSEIGRRAGFSDPSHFARVYRPVCGRTPASARWKETWKSSDHSTRDSRTSMHVVEGDDRSDRSGGVAATDQTCAEEDAETRAEVVFHRWGQEPGFTGT
jgi:AraC-like DNA-binding protein